jgi:hypothetical protein
MVILNKANIKQAIDEMKKIKNELVQKQVAMCEKRDKLNKEIETTAKKINELSQKNRELRKQYLHETQLSKYIDKLHKIFNTLPECVNADGLYPPLVFPKNKQHKTYRLFPSETYDANIIEATRQVIIKRFINTTTDKVRKEAYSLCLKSLDNMRNGKYPKHIYYLFEKQQHKKLSIIVAAIFIEACCDLEILSTINEYVKSFDYPFTAYITLLMHFTMLAMVKEQNISLSHSTRTKIPHLSLPSIIHQIGNCDIINSFNEILQIQDLTGKKEYKRVPKYKENKRTKLFSFSYLNDYPIELLLNELNMLPSENIRLPYPYTFYFTLDCDDNTKIMAVVKNAQPNDNANVEMYRLDKKT